MRLRAGCGAGLSQFGHEQDGEEGRGEDVDLQRQFPSVRAEGVAWSAHTGLEEDGIQALVCGGDAAREVLHGCEGLEIDKLDFEDGGIDPRSRRDAAFRFLAFLAVASCEDDN